MLPLAQKLEPVLAEADIEGHFSDQIRRDALQKFSYVSPLGAAGLYFDAVSGDFLREGEVWFYGYSENPDDPNEEPELRYIEDDDEYEAVADKFDEYLDNVEFDEIVDE